MPRGAPAQNDVHQGDVEGRQGFGVDPQAHARVGRFVIRPKRLHVDGTLRRLPHQLPLDRETAQRGAIRRFARWGRW